jgi:hypothetical protein
LRQQQSDEGENRLAAIPGWVSETRTFAQGRGCHLKFGAGDAFVQTLRHARLGSGGDGSGEVGDRVGLVGRGFAVRARQQRIALAPSHEGPIHRAEAQMMTQESLADRSHAPAPAAEGSAVFGKSTQRRSACAAIMASTIC